MTHYGSVATQVITDEIRDIRGTSVRGADGTKLGEVTDVIVDHETMKIQYLVVDSEGWLEAGTFLLPAGRVSADESDANNLAAGVTRQQLENSPQYKKQSLQSGDEWRKYDLEFKKYWEEEPVMHIKGSDRIITPPGEPIPIRANAGGQKPSESSDSEVSAANLFPERIAPVFSDPAPGSGKVTLRPKSVARAEEAASGATLLKPRWWESFENYLRLNKDDIKGKCPQCTSKVA